MFKYPVTRADPTSDNYHGTVVADPYRWLEDDNAADTKAWVVEQNRLTEAYLSQVAERPAIRQRVAELWDFEKFGLPVCRGGHYFSFYNTGLQNQAALYVSTDYRQRGRLLLDPNTMSADGTFSLSGTSFSDDGSLVAWAGAQAGSDWVVWRVRDVATGQDLADEIRWCKHGQVAWLKDGSGFFYSRFAAPAAGAELTAVNQGQMVYFHRLGDDQAADRLIFERPDQPEWYLGPELSDDGDWLIIYAAPGCNPETGVFVVDLRQAGAVARPFLADFDASYEVVDSSGPDWLVVTNLQAGRRRLLAIPRDYRARSEWRELIPEDAAGCVLDSVLAYGDQLLALYMRDARSELRRYARDGQCHGEIGLPGIGTVLEADSHRPDNEAFLLFCSFGRPNSLYRFDGASARLELVAEPKLAFRPDDFVTSQVFYPSKDGTLIPLFLAHRRGLRLDGNLPTLLYGYGGFNIPVRPRFEPTEMAWMDRGGLLVGACLTQRPELFGAAVPEVGVHDMLRYHKFTLGWGWTSDYACSDDPAGFGILMKYSPLHNVKPGTAFPPTLVMTCDHDDRVVPAHSHKFTATLQAAQAGAAPVLTRINTAAGHGAGMPTGKRIDERADLIAFLVAALGW